MLHAEQFYVSGQRCEAQQPISAVSYSKNSSLKQNKNSKSAHRAKFPILKISILTAMSISLSSCGTITGIPAHGESWATTGVGLFFSQNPFTNPSARASIKNMDLSALTGRRVALYVSVIGDQGSGVLSGGRYSLDALIRGEYQNLESFAKLVDVA